MKLLTKATVFLAAATLALGGCSSNSGDDASNDVITIGVAVPNQEAPFFNGVRQAIEAEAEATTDREVKIIVVDAKDSADTQVSQIQDLITQDVDAIIYIPAGATAATVPVRSAHAAGIPIVTVDRNPEEPGDTFIATDAEGASRELGEYVVEQTNGEGKLAVIQGQLGTTPEEMRAKGFDGVIADTNIEKVAEQASDAWHRDEGFSIAQDMLQAHPEITIIFGRADALALGAAQAVRGAGMEDQVMIVGFDGDPDGLEAVRDGVIDATMCQQVNKIGQLSLQSAIKLADGEELPPEQLQDAILVTSDNAEEYIANHP